MGLAIVKHALQRHGGWLDVHSVEGKGSTFTCHFPQQRIWKLALRNVGERMKVTNIMYTVDVTLQSDVNERSTS